MGISHRGFKDFNRGFLLGFHGFSYQQHEHPDMAPVMIWLQVPGLPRNA